MIGRTNVGGGGKTVAFITAIYPSGSTCTCTNSTSTKTLYAKDTSGTYIFMIPENDTWTIYCSDGTHSAYTAVETSTGGSYSVLLSYVLYLVQNGTYNRDYTPSKAGYRNATLEEKEGGYFDYTTTNAVASTSKGTCYYSPMIDLTPYTYLILDYQVRSLYNSSNKVPVFGVIDTLGTDVSTSYTSFIVEQFMLEASQYSFNTRGIDYIDISNVSGLHYVGYQIAGASNQTNKPVVRCFNFYLSNELPS